MLLTIEEGKWFKVIVQMIKVAFLKLSLCKTSSNFSFQFTFVVNFDCSPCLPLLVLRHSTIYPTSRNDFCMTRLLVAPLTIISNDNVQHNVKHKSNFDESSQFLNKEIS